MESNNLIKYFAATFFGILAIAFLFAKPGPDGATIKQRERMKHNLLGKCLNPYFWEFKKDGSPRKYTKKFYFAFFMTIAVLIAFSINH